MMMDANSFKELPLRGIARGIDEEDIGPLLETVIGAGLRTIEITMNTPRAAGIISRANDISAGRITVGAGTVPSICRRSAANKVEKAAHDPPQPAAPWPTPSSWPAR